MNGEYKVNKIYIRGLGQVVYEEGLTAYCNNVFYNTNLGEIYIKKPERRIYKPEECINMTFWCESMEIHYNKERKDNGYKD